MEWLEVALLAVCVGVVVGLVAIRQLHPGHPGRSPAEPEPRRARPALAGNPGDEITDAGVADVLAVLGDIAIVVDVNDTVVMHSQSAVPLGLVRDSDLTHAALRTVVRGVRRDGVIRQMDLDVPRGPMGEGTLSLNVRVAPLGARHVLLLVEDRTQARRVEEVRRDFVANVSHELKTPVGGISLLAEAIADASDDPEAVARFASRIGAESRRLSTLVAEIVELSRLQTQQDDPPDTLVDMAVVTREAVDATRTLAEGRDIVFAEAIAGQSWVYGDANQLRTAVGNLLTNAVNYSPPRTRVAVTVRTRGFVIEVAVADQGTGIAAADLDRIFERFYRADPARSRATGGTGLGLAIVKHVCSNHGGEVTVWSSEGHGSTFTIRLPSASHGPATPGTDRDAINSRDSRAAGDSAAASSAPPQALPDAPPDTSPAATRDRGSTPSGPPGPTPPQYSPTPSEEVRR